MTLAAEGVLARPLAALANLLASSVRLRTVLSVADAAAALAKIYYPESDDREDPNNPGHLMDARPRVVIYQGENFRLERLGPGERRESGSLNVSFEFLIPDQYKASKRDSGMWFLNQTGVIIDEACANSGLGDGSGNQYLNANMFDLINGPAPCDADEEIEEFHGAEFLLSWP